MKYKIIMQDTQSPAINIYGEIFISHDWKFIIVDNLANIVKIFNRYSEAENFLNELNSNESESLNV